MAQSGLPAVDGLNEEELVRNGVKVGTLKQLLARSAEEKDDEDITEGSGPPKLISLSQVTVRGEDLTGRPLYTLWDT